MAMSLEELEKMVLETKDKLDGILNTVNESETKFKYDNGLAEFKERNSSKLDKYRDTLKKLNGEDFDLDKSAYDEYNENFSDIDEATYISQLTSEIESKLSKMREALSDGDVAEATHIAEDLAEDTQEAADKLDEEAHEDVAEDEKKDEGETEEENADESEADKEDEEDEDKSELDDFQKELEEEYETYHK